MKLKTITVTYGRKLNLGDYNSSHVEMSLWAELDEGDCEIAASEALRQMARNNVMSELARLQPKLDAKVQDIFMGLPVDVQKKVMGSVDENDIPYTTDRNGVRNYHGKNAEKAIEKDLAEIERKASGGY